MRNFLFLLFLTFGVLSVSAQSDQHAVRGLQPQPVNMALSRPQVKMETMQMREPGTPVVKTSRKTAPSTSTVFRRPAGAFNCQLVVKDGYSDGILFYPTIAVKPYACYTFINLEEGVSPVATYEWVIEDDSNEDGWMIVQGKDLIYKWGIGTFKMPPLWVYDSYLIYVNGEQISGRILSYPNTKDFLGEDYLKSSKHFDYNHDTPFTYISGADPDGKGYWFGKNSGIGKYRVNGIAQAFEKPEHPYLLKQVVMECTELQVSAPVEMSCKVYQLDSIPAYQDDDEAVLPDEPGQLLCKGRAIITPESAASNASNELVTFTLYQDLGGLEVEATPAIDCAILVVIDGYNDPGMENLVNFSALIYTNIHEDEGFGELAYLKFGTPVENSDQYRYVWAGLNNFFTSGEMKTGLSIYLSTELPYLAFKQDEEDGVYHFPDDGGLMEKQFNDTTTSSIEFLSWEPSADDYWWVHCNGNDVPDWLTIKLEDQMENGEFAHIVNARVTAEPLPQGVNYREAVVRFEYPGAYQDYKFIQSRQIGPNPPPEPNIATVNLIINIILGANYPEEEMRRYDINGDGVVNISDLNLVVHYIIEH